MIYQSSPPSVAVVFKVMSAFASTPPQSPALASMTGFARREGMATLEQGDDAWTQGWAIEVRSVNGKGRDIRMRLPAGLEAMEAPLRTLIEARLARGSITLAVSLVGETDLATHPLRLNHAMLRQALAVAREVARLSGQPNAPPPSLDVLLNMRGLMSADATGGQDQACKDALRHSLLDGAAHALDGLVAARREEGAHLAAALTALLESIEALTRQAGAAAAAQPAFIKARLLACLQPLLEASPPLPEERLAHEVALLAVKADIQEELQRLAAHAAQARAMLAGGGAVGRKLDFLCQELNREANTLCSKSSDLELTRIGLDLKAAIDQLREQVQNVE
jgi:uncharacterized protein (TIGR00255 family)